MKKYAILYKDKNIVHTVVVVPENTFCNLDEELYNNVELQDGEMCQPGWNYNLENNPRFFIQ